MSGHEASPRQQGGVAGAGIGTGYLGVLSGMPESYHWLKDTLVYLAPVITVISTVIWVFLAAWAMKKMVVWHLDGAIKEAESLCSGVVADCNASSEEKNNALQAVSDLKKLKMDAITDSVSTVRARLDRIQES